MSEKPVTMQCEGCERCEILKKLGLENGCQDISNAIQEHVLGGFRTVREILSAQVPDGLPDEMIRNGQRIFAEVATEVFLTVAAVNAFHKLHVKQSRFVFESAKAFEGAVNDFALDSLMKMTERAEAESIHEEAVKQSGGLSS